MIYIAFLSVILTFLFLFYLAVAVSRKESLFDTPYNVEWTNCIKGAAILVIACGHLGNSFGVRYLNPLGAIGVACFLIMSGYGTSASFEKKGLRGFWIKKLAIYVPYVVTEVIGYVLFWRPGSVWDILLDLLLIKPLHPFGWYMRFLAAWYVLFYVSKLLKNKYWRIAIPALAAFVFYFAARTLVAENSFSFVLGMLLFRYRDRLFGLLEKTWFICGAFVSGALFLMIKQMNAVRNLPMPVYKLVLVLVAVSFAAFIISFFGRLQKCRWKAAGYFFLSMGKISYEFYLLHAFPLILLGYAGLSFFSLLLFFIMTIVISSIFHSVCSAATDRIKMLSLGKKEKHDS